jgi:hypothetical protein
MCTVRGNGGGVDSGSGVLTVVGERNGLGSHLRYSITSPR